MDWHFEHPVFGWLLAILLPAAGLWWLWEKKKKSIIEKMGSNPRLLSTLFIGYAPGMAPKKLLYFSISFILLVLAAMNPVKVQERANVPVEGLEVMLAMDVSQSMYATDIAPNRFEKARSFGVRMTEKLAGNKVGLLAFAGEARLQMPPSTDLSAIRQGLQTLNYKSVALQGTNLEEALRVGFQSLSSDAFSKKVVVIITDGEELEGDGLKMAKEYSKKGLMIYVAGVGTAEGSFLNDPETNQPLKGEDNNRVKSSLNEKLLRSFAGESGGTYFTLTGIETDSEDLMTSLNRVEKSPLENTELVNYYSLAPWLVLAALLFIVFPYVKLSNFRLLGKKRMAIKAAAWLLSGLFAKNGFSQAGTLKEANSAYQSGEFQEAVSRYNKVLQAEPGNTQALFYKALSAFKLGELQGAAGEFLQLAQESAEKETAAAAFNNAGLALVKSKKFPEAIEAFKKAVRATPGDTDIVHNLQKALADWQKENQPPPPAKDNKDNLDKGKASSKLESVMEEERKTREKMKPSGKPNSTGKNW